MIHTNLKMKRTSTVWSSREEFSAKKKLNLLENKWILNFKGFLGCTNCNTCSKRGCQ